MRVFDTGATRDSLAGKLDFEGFLSYRVLERYAEYMNTHRKQSDGSLRDSDNWQKGIPRDVYIKSLWRHFFSFWKLHRGGRVLDERDQHDVTLEEALCGILFNTMGYLHELLKEKECCGQTERNGQTECCGQTKSHTLPSEYCHLNDSPLSKKGPIINCPPIVSFVPAHKDYRPTP